MSHKIIFIIGLICFLIGQIILAQGNDFVYEQQPIDFAHWFLFLGVVLMIPQVVSFPKSIYTYIGSPLTLIGIVCMIGMCVLDFIFWSYESVELRNEFFNHIGHIFSPSTIVLGGGISKKFDEYDKHFDDFQFEVKPAKLLNHAGIIGAAMYGLQKSKILVNLES